MKNLIHILKKTMLNVSIVLYNQSRTEIIRLIETFLHSETVYEVFLIDNSPIENPDFKTLGANYHFTGKNLGYGTAHNIAIRKTIEQGLPYHLVINPDISFDPSILSEIEEFMNNNSDIGLLMPKILYPNGEIQYLCKLIPTPFDLIFRRFLPKSWTKIRTQKFELHDSGRSYVSTRLDEKVRRRSGRWPYGACRHLCMRERGPGPG